ncbi:hypothetical protein [Streptomyces melanogenes]|uniref:Small hydrophilic protein n=1 Tax=Streptomyces melanogenes TaxID=67326 RepID=A0ABZ1XUR2_9ACTN|nr:hypothetical protein [Streptomyces melanogenes]
MAKNKNRDRSQQQKAAQAAERGQQAAQQSAMEVQAKSAAEASPGDVAPEEKARRRGHE